MAFRSFIRKPGDLYKSIHVIACRSETERLLYVAFASYIYK